MERLTPISSDRWNGKQAFCESDCKQDCNECYTYDMFLRLADYEDTGCEPAEIEQLKKDFKDLKADYAELNDMYDMETNIRY